MYESTATWSEEKVFAGDDDYHSYMGTWADNPFQPITSASGLKMYGSAIWNHWLEQHYGAETVRRASEESIASGAFAPAAYDLAIKAARRHLLRHQLRRLRGGGGRVGRQQQRHPRGRRLHPQRQARDRPADDRHGRPHDDDRPHRVQALQHPGPGGGEHGPAEADRVAAPGRRRRRDRDSRPRRLRRPLSAADDLTTKVVARTNAAGDAVVARSTIPTATTGSRPSSPTPTSRNAGFNPVADDWVWTRDAQVAKLTLTTDSRATRRHPGRRSRWQPGRHRRRARPRRAARPPSSAQPADPGPATASVDRDAGPDRLAHGHPDADRHAAASPRRCG